MNYLKIYQISFIILFPIVIIFGCCDFFVLLAALSNPQLLLGVCMIAAVVLYTFSSWSFYQKGVVKQVVCKHWLKDFIKANAYVGLVFSCMGVIQSITVLVYPNVINEIITNSQIKMPAGFSIEDFKKIIHYSLIFSLVFSTILTIHIVFTLRILKTYESFFQRND